MTARSKLARMEVTLFSAKATPAGTAQGNSSGGRPAPQLRRERTLPEAKARALGGQVRMSPAPAPVACIALKGQSQNHRPLRNEGLGR
jgi:hypothetical protein